MDDIHALREQAETAERRRLPDVAFQNFFKAAEQIHAHEREYAPVIVAFGEHLLKRGLYRSAVATLWYLSPSDPSAFDRARLLFERLPARDRGRTLVAIANTKMRGVSARKGDPVPSDAKELLLAAAEAFEADAWFVSSAIQLEEAGAFAEARARWSRLTRLGAGKADQYQSALMYFNLARMAKCERDLPAARTAFVSAVRLLEEAADHFEQKGQRERAFDCFQVLIEVGKAGASFENVLEGFVNCIRILKEDHLKYFALQHFDESIREAKEKKEFAAAAVLAREGADYARSIGMPDLFGFYALEQGSLWTSVFAQHVERNDPPEIAENALLAAILAYGEVGRYATVGELYGKLSELELEPRRKEHYARARERYRNEADERRPTSPMAAHLKNDMAPTEVWHADLLEWEQAGSPHEAAADILLDRRWPDIVRRKALLARIAADLASGSGRKGSEATVQLATRLGQMQLYGVLAALERLYEDGTMEVKIAVVRAMSTLFFKRTFATIRRAAHESDATLLEATGKTVAALYFPHAFDPLSRILRDSTHAGIRSGAIRAIARIDTLEAAEFVLGLLDHGTPDDKSATLDGLRGSHGTRFVDLARSLFSTLSPRHQEIVREALRLRQVSV